MDTLYWIIALVVLLWCALSNLCGTVARFLDAPTKLVTTDTISSNIQFPAVLVCPEVYYPDHKIEHFLKYAKYPVNMSANTIRPIIKQLSAFFSPDPPYDVNELSQILRFLNYNDLDVEQAGVLLSSTCDEILFRCRFVWEDYKCSNIFRMEITLYGFCCVFNGKSLKRELKRRRILGVIQSRVWHTTDVGPFASLMLAINQSHPLGNVDLSYKWLVIQSHHRYVDIAKNGTPLSPGAEMWSSFQIRYLHISDDSFFMSDSLRGCGTQNKTLKYFPTYNKKTCLLECGMQELIQHCRCLLPFHYRPLGVPLCDAASLPCAKKTLEQYDRSSCDCKIVCDYQAEVIDTVTYKFSSMARPFDSFYEGLDLNRMTVARIFIKSYETTSYVRRPIFNFYDLFSQLGGVFNVFFGCSILSILELLQLAWYSFKDTSKTREVKRLAPETIKSDRKKNVLLFGVCSRTSSGRVRKVSKSKKKVTFFKKKTLNDLPWVK